MLANHCREFTLRCATESDFPALSELEAASFPPDEAASHESMLYRCQVANPYFMCFCDPATGSPLGFINGTCISSSTISHESMSSHDPQGSSLVIHSVTVSPSHRRKGLGAAMLRDYIQEIAGIKSVEQILLLSKPYLLDFYTSCGFSIDRLSPVHHGQVTNTIR